MNKNFFTINLILIILFFIFSYNKVLSFENKIEVMVDDKIITTIDINNEITYLKALNVNLKSLDDNKIFEIAKTSLIREKIKEIEISKLKYKKVDENYLENVITSIYKNIGFNNKEDFLIYIENLNINISTIELKLSNEALWNQIIYKKYYSKLKINEDKIRKEIQQNNKEILSYLLFEIIYNSEKTSDAKKIFQEIEKSINENGFENTASIFSVSESSKTGGKIGWVEETLISNEILGEISKLEIGNYTNPIQIPGGFLILHIKDKKKMKKNVDLEKEVALKIRNLQNQQLNQFSNIFFNKIKKDIVINEI